RPARRRKRPGPDDRDDAVRHRPQIRLAPFESRLARRKRPAHRPPAGIRAGSPRRRLIPDRPDRFRPPPLPGRRRLNLLAPATGPGRWSAAASLRPAMPTPDGSPDHSPDFTPPAPEELSALLPQYRIDRLIAAGGMGAVYRGEHRELERPVAIKVLPPEYARDSDAIERFRIEAKAMARLTHPNIPSVFDFDVVGGICYLVMEFVEGSDVH